MSWTLEQGDRADISQAVPGYHWKEPVGNTRWDSE